MFKMDKFDKKDYLRSEETDFKRKPDEDKEDDDEVELNEKAKNYIASCLTEKEKIVSDFPIASRLIDEEIEKVQTTGRIPTRDRKYVDIYREKPVRVAQKILVPVKENPKFNFVGKLLGPKGNSLRRLQEETLCKMVVLGRNSMKDRAKEEELRASKDPKYAHLNDDLHVEISTVAPPAEAHARIAYAMAELRKYLIPDSNDVIRQEQLRELMENPQQVDYEPGPMPPYKRNLSNGSKPGFGRNPPARSSMAPNQKVLSILDRARSAMDDTYRSPSSRTHYEEPIAYQPRLYKGYSYSHGTPPPPPSRPQPYEQVDYDAPEYRREYYSTSPNYGAAKGNSSSARPWKPTSAGAGLYSSRRNDDFTNGSSNAKHIPSVREARYRSAPYARAK